jgi:surface polysaccharide O-acyltransferase-like enzyme
MELLRILAMAMVMMCHTNFWSLGEPTMRMCADEPIRVFIQYLIESLAVVCVNCFVFISGWFSIKLTKRGFANLVFQLLFYSVLIYLVFLAFGLIRFNIKDFLWHCDFFSNFWFIRAYIPLFLLSPILNVFIDKAGKQTARTVLLAYAFIEIMLVWFIDFVDKDKGYCLLHLSFVYLLARYIKVYGERYFTFDKWRDLSIYLVISIGTAVIIMLSSYLLPAVWWHSGKMFLYNSPLVLLASIYLSLFFTKLDIKSKAVNIVAASSFAVFLIHGDPLILKPYVKPFCQNLFFNNNIFYFSIMMALLIVALFVVAFLVDQVRQWLWRMIQKAFF